MTISVIRDRRYVRRYVVHEFIELILLVVIDEEEPQEVLRLNAEALIEKFKADTSASYQALANTDEFVANELAKLRDALDREIERRVDDVADNVCDLLEHLSDYLRAEAGTSPELANKVDANLAGDTASKEAERRHAKIAEAAYHRAELRHFEPGHDLEDWLAAESDLGLR